MEITFQVRLLEKGKKMFWYITEKFKISKGFYQAWKRLGTLG